MSGQHTPGQTIEAAAKRLLTLRGLARLEQHEFGAVSSRTLRAIESAIAAAEAVCIVDDARSAKPSPGGK
jgi:hypothetical protein